MSTTHIQASPSHVIYCVIGKKVGCTKNLANRRHAYRRQYGHHVVIRILEVLYDKTDQEAGDIEWQYADKLGYKRGVHYTVTINAVRSPGAWITRPSDRAAKSRGGYTRAARLSQQQQIMIARSGADARWRRIAS